MVFNAGAERMFGYRADEVVGTVAMDFFHDKDEMVERARLLSVELGFAVAPGGETLVAKVRPDRLDESQWTYIRKDGTRFPGLLSMSAIYNSAGEVTGFMGIIQDITERKRAEQALLASEHRYRLLAENMRNVVWTVDMTMNRTYVSSSIELLTGHTVEEAMQLRFDEVLTPSSSKCIRGVFLKILAESKTNPRVLLQPVCLDMEYQCKNGGSIWTEANMSWLLGEDGTPVGGIGASRDITARKRAEEALSASEHRYRLLAENMRDVVWTVDMNMNRTYVSPSDGASDGSHGGRSLATAVRRGPQPGVRQAHQRSIFEHPSQGPDRSERSLAARVPRNGIPVQERRHDLGRGQHVVAVRRGRKSRGRNGRQPRHHGPQERPPRNCRNTPANWKQANHELAEATMAAQAANKAKDQFLASHEPRAAHAVERRDRHDGVAPRHRSLTTANATFVEACHSSGQSLLALINDILDFSKIEAGKLELDEHEFDLGRHGGRNRGDDGLSSRKKRAPTGRAASPRRPAAGCAATTCGCGRSWST